VEINVDKYLLWGAKLVGLSIAVAVIIPAMVLFFKLLAMAWLWMVVGQMGSLGSVL
jgi:hypothetical protein